jgi:hypothetical protein
MPVAEILRKAHIPPAQMGEASHHFAQLIRNIRQMRQMALVTIAMIERQIERSELGLSHQLPGHVRTAVNKFRAQFHWSAEGVIVKSQDSTANSVAGLKKQHRAAFARQDLGRCQAGRASAEDDDIGTPHGDSSMEQVLAGLPFSRK